MLWCFIGSAILFALLAVVILTVRPPRLPRPRLRLGRMVRGCFATALLLMAGGLLGVALFTLGWPQ